MRFLLIFIGFLVSVSTLAQYGKLNNQQQYFNPAYAPFYHGVASGDPLDDRVIIWTRITLDSTFTSAQVEWYLATDTAFTNVIAQGTETTDASIDFTVKVDVTGLSPNTTYFYVFKYGSVWSLTGRTKTAPTGTTDHLKFAVVSCSNYEAGFFNAYRNIARKHDLDAVIHLGDYIYEYGIGEYGDTGATQRYNDPSHEVVAKDDYRMRYSLYRLDSSLIRAHQMHPFIAVWDDHESANDAYMDGAENHNPNNVYDGVNTEGSWTTRKNVSREVYFEWLPIRNSGTSIYRTINYGNLADIFMLDTRIEGRTEQPFSILDTNFNSPRDLLGSAQKNWLFNELDASTAKWKVIGNQIIFSPLNVGFAAGFNDGMPDPTNFDSIVAVESIFLDIWDGYPAERQEIIDTIESKGWDNIVILTGDFHSSFAFDVTPTPVIYPVAATAYLPVIDTSVYNPATGKGSVAVEFATPSINSANFDENVGAAASAIFENWMNNPIELPPGSGNFFTYNPHMKYTDLDQHGYYILDLKPDSVTANFYFADDILSVTNGEQFGEALRSLDGENYLQVTTESGPKNTQQPVPPLDPRFSTIGIGESSDLAIMGLYPNPSQDYHRLFIAINHPAPLSLSLISLNGQVLDEVDLGEKSATRGFIEIYRDIHDLDAGIYFYQVRNGNQTATIKFMKH
jgi:alkaline phosphatase D